MVDCFSTPDKNTTLLDTIDLDGLDGFMTSVPWGLSLSSSVIFELDILDVALCYWSENNETNTFLYRAPTVDDYRNLLGTIAVHGVARV